MYKFIDLFAGIGGFRTGLEKLGWECVGYCEYDKYARKSYEAIYDITNEWFCDDIRKAHGSEMPNADVWTFGFPCQDISIAGEKKGMSEGTRSGLFYQVMRLLKEREESEKDKPEWLIIENVKNLLSIDGGWGFYNVLCEVDKRGYDAQWRVFNSKDYGVPQNRERVYIIGHHRQRGRRKVLFTTRESGNVIKNVGNIVTPKEGSPWTNPQRGRVYSPEGLAPALNTCSGGGLEPKIIINGKLPTGGQRGVVYDVNGIVGSLVATDYKTPKLIEDKSVRAILTPDRLVKRQNGRRYKENGEPMFTITTQDRHGIIINDMCIRKLTPKECWRLQGFTDEQFDKASQVNSDSQLYKQAGNAVTVNVVEFIGRAILNSEVIDQWKELNAYDEYQD